MMMEASLLVDSSPVSRDAVCGIPSAVGLVNPQFSLVKNMEVLETQGMDSQGDLEKGMVGGEGNEESGLGSSETDLQKISSQLPNHQTIAGVIEENRRIQAENVRLEQEGEMASKKISVLEDQVENLTTQLQNLQAELHRTKQSVHEDVPSQENRLEEENNMLRQENYLLKEQLKNVPPESHNGKETNSSIPEAITKVEYVPVIGMHEILENFLWLGDRFAASEISVLNKLGITHLLTLYGTHPHEYVFRDIHARCIPLEDDGSSDLGLVFKQCFEFIDMARTSGQKILVHCAAGINRSPSIVIAYLMKTQQWRFQQAFDFVKEKRWIIHPAWLYLEQLSNYEEILFGNKESQEDQTANSSSGFSFMKLLTFWFAPNGLSRPVIF